MGGMVGQTIQGFNVGLAEMLSIPTRLNNLAREAVGMETVPDARQVFEKLGVISGRKPENIAEEFVGRIGEELGAVTATGGAVLGAGRAVGRAGGVVANLLREAARDPVGFLRRELKLGVGAGAGAGVAEQVAPDQPLVELGAQIAGATIAGRPPKMPAGQKAVAESLEQAAGVEGRLLRSEITEGEAAVREVIPDYPVTVAQATGRPGLAGMEQSMRGQEYGRPLSERLSYQQQLEKEALLGPSPIRMEPEQAGLAIREELETGYKAVKGARKTAAEPLFTAAEKSTTPVDTKSILDFVDERIGATKGAIRSALESVRNDLFSGKELDTTASGMMATRKAIGERLDAIGERRLSNLQRTELITIRDKIDEVMQAVPEFAQAQAEFKRLSSPVNIYTERPAVSGVLEKDRLTKRYDIEASQVPKEFVGLQKAQPETFRQLVEATGSRSNAVEAAKNILGQTLERKMSSGEGVLTAQKMGEVVANFAPLIREAYGPDQLQRINELRRVVAMREVSTKPVSAWARQSTTAEKMAGTAQIIDTLWPGRALALKFPFAAQWGRRALQGAGEREAQRRAVILRDAMLDPQIAKDLLTKLDSVRAEQAITRLNLYLANTGQE